MVSPGGQIKCIRSQEEPILLENVHGSCKDLAKTLHLCKEKWSFLLILKDYSLAAILSSHMQEKWLFFQGSSKTLVQESCTTVLPGFKAVMYCSLGSTHIPYPCLCALGYAKQLFQLSWSSWPPHWKSSSYATVYTGSK